MDIWHLRVFSAFAQTLNYTHAAHELYVSRQAVSKTIRNMESELGTHLVKTSGKKIELTPEGRLFALQSQSIIEQFDTLVQVFSKQDGINGSQAQEPPIRLGFSSSLFTPRMSLLMRKVTAFAKELPGESIALSQGSARRCYEEVVDGMSDAALVVCMPRRFSDCVSVRLGAMPFAFVSLEDNPLCSRDAISVADLKDQRLILLKDYEFVYPGLIDACAQNGFSLQPAHLLGEYELALSAMLDGDGSLIIDKREIPGRWPENVKAVPFAEPELRWELYFIYRRNSKRLQSILKLVDFLRTCDIDGFTAVEDISSVRKLEY